MPDTVHAYTARVTWTGNRGVGTTNRRAFSRDTETTSGAKPLLVGSSDPVLHRPIGQLPGRHATDDHRHGITTPKILRHDVRPVSSDVA